MKRKLRKKSQKKFSRNLHYFNLLHFSIQTERLLVCSANPLSHRLNPMRKKNQMKNQNRPKMLLLHLRILSWHNKQIIIHSCSRLLIRNQTPSQRTHPSPNLSETLAQPSIIWSYWPKTHHKRHSLRFSLVELQHNRNNHCSQCRRKIRVRPNRLLNKSQGQAVFSEQAYHRCSNLVKAHSRFLTRRHLVLDYLEVKVQVYLRLPNNKEILHLGLRCLAEYRPHSRHNPF